MKDKYTIFFIFLSLFGYSQALDLIKLATGKFENFNAVLDNQQKLYGYVAIYDLGLNENRNRKLEYYLFDKNLNALAHNTFEADNTAVKYYPYLTDENKSLVLTPSFFLYDYSFKNSFYTPSEYIINLKNNNIKKRESFEFDGYNLVALAKGSTNKERKKKNSEFKDKNGVKYISNVARIDNGDITVDEFKYKGWNRQDHLLHYYNSEGNELWKFRFFDNNDDKSQLAVFKVMASDEDVMIAKVSRYSKASTTFSVMVFDVHTGKVLLEEPTPYKDSFYFSIPSDTGDVENKLYEKDRITLLCRFSGVSYNTEGFEKMTYDKGKNTIIFYGTNFREDIFQKYPELTELKEPFDQYDLDFKSIDFLGDDTIVIAEKINRQKKTTTDLVVMFFNKNMEIKNLKVLPKEKSNAEESGFLFAQTLDNKKNLVFFYKDSQKKKGVEDWTLYINTYIDNIFKQEKMKISSKSSLITPYIAKEGYILLREFSDDQKNNQIRLERLNY